MPAPVSTRSLSTSARTLWSSRIDLDASGGHAGTNLASGFIRLTETQLCIFPSIPKIHTLSGAVFELFIEKLSRNENFTRRTVKIKVKTMSETQETHMG